MKRGRKPSSGGTSVDVSYREIMQDVLRIQALIGDVKKLENEKLRKKRRVVVKNKVEDTNVRNPNEGVVQKKKYEVSNLEKIREKIQEHEEENQLSPVGLVQPQSEVSQPEILVGNAEENTAVINPKQQIAVNESTDGNKLENQSATEVIGNQDQSVGGQTDESHHWVFDEQVSSVEEKRAARLAKYNIDPNEEIITTKLKFDKSGQDWGTWSDAIDSDDEKLESQ